MAGSQPSDVTEFRGGTSAHGLHVQVEPGCELLKWSDGNLPAAGTQLIASRFCGLASTDPVAIGVAVAMLVRVAPLAA